MGRPRKERRNWDAFGTLWQVSDELWAQLAPVLAEGDPPKPTGRPRIDPRAALNAILFRLPVSPTQRLPVEPVARALSRR